MMKAVMSTRHERARSVDEFFEDTHALAQLASGQAAADVADAHKRGVSSYFGDAEGHLFERRPDGAIIPLSTSAALT